MQGGNFIDLVLVLLLAYGTYLGFTNGIIKTFFSVISIVFGVLAVSHFSPAVSSALQALFNKHTPMMFLVAVLVTFLLTMIFLRTVARGLEGVLEAANINIINQLAGAVLISAMFIFLYSWVLFFMDKARMLNESTKEKSYSYQMLQNVPDYAKIAWTKSSPAFKEFWDRTLDAFDKVGNMVETDESAPTFRDMPEDDANAGQEEQQ
jgi:membrane protein required for colicin V production